MKNDVFITQRRPTSSKSEHVKAKKLKKFTHKPAVYRPSIIMSDGLPDKLIKEEEKSYE